MKRPKILLPVLFLQLLSMRVINLVQQHIAPIASLHHFVRRRGIARYHNLPIASLELISIGLFPYPMLHRKRSHRNVFVAIPHSRPERMHVDFVSRSVRLLQSAPPNPHILFPSLLDVRSHILQPMRTISLQRLRPPQHPRRKNQVRIAQRVIRMQMRYKNDLQFFCLQSRHPILLRRRCPPHHSRTAVDQIRPIIHHHRHRRAPPIRLRARIPGPQYNHASSRSGRIPSESASATSNRRQEYNNNLHSKPPWPPTPACHVSPESNVTVSAFPGLSPRSPVPPVVMLLASARSS